MSQRRLWGHPKSINVQKVLWALDELGLEYERIDAGGTFGKNRDADYLSLNPNGLIPVLEDGGAALWESNAIVRYLYGKYGKNPELPSDPAARARADGWHDWYVTSFWAHVRPLLVQFIRTQPSGRDQNVIETALRGARAGAEILERELAKHPYLAGDHFTFGDIPTAAAAQRWFNLPIERAPAPHFESWYARVKVRPAFQRWIDLPLF